MDGPLHTLLSHIPCIEPASSEVKYEYTSAQKLNITLQNQHVIESDSLITQRRSMSSCMFHNGLVATVHLGLKSEEIN